MSGFNACLPRWVSTFLKISRNDVHVFSICYRTSVSTAPPNDSRARNFAISSPLCEHSESEASNDSDVDSTTNSKPEKLLSVLFEKTAVWLDRSQGVECSKERKERSAKSRVSLRELEKGVRDSGKREDSDNNSESSTRKTSEEATAKEGTNAAGFLCSLFKNARTRNRTPGDLDLTSARSITPRSLDLLTGDDPTTVKDLPEDITFFVKYLYDKGYLSGAKFLPENKFDIRCFRKSYGREYIKSAAAKFGHDNRDIAKGLSVSDLKKVIRFGCPSLAKKAVYAAKGLRSFYQINEEKVCSKCVLSESCNLKNRILEKNKGKNLNLRAVMRVISLYALELTPPQLRVPDDVRASALRLIREAQQLSLKTPRPVNRTSFGCNSPY